MSYFARSKTETTKSKWAKLKSLLSFRSSRIPFSFITWLSCTWWICFREGSSQFFIGSNLILAPTWQWLFYSELNKKSLSPEAYPESPTNWVLWGRTKGKVIVFRPAFRKRRQLLGSFLQFLFLIMYSVPLFWVTRSKAGEWAMRNLKGARRATAATSVASTPPMRPASMRHRLTSSKNHHHWPKIKNASFWKHGRFSKRTSPLLASSSSSSECCECGSIASTVKNISKKPCFTYNTYQMDVRIICIDVEYVGFHQNYGSFLEMEKSGKWSAMEPNGIRINISFFRVQN